MDARRLSNCYLVVQHRYSVNLFRIVTVHTRTPLNLPISAGRYLFFYFLILHIYFIILRIPFHMLLRRMIKKKKLSFLIKERNYYYYVGR